MCQAVSDMLTFLLAIPLTCGVLVEMKRKEGNKQLEGVRGQYKC